MLEGQINLRDAVRRTITFTSPEGQELRAQREDGDAPRAAARLAPAREARRWSTASRSPAALFDFGLYFFHNAKRAARARHGPVLLPAQDGEPPRGAPLERRLRPRAGGARASRAAPSRRPCSSRRILAAFEMDEILYELREHSAGLNCGRWDYIFSFIKKLRKRPELRPARPRAGHDGPRTSCGPTAQLAHQDLPPPRRPRDGRHGGADPDQERPGGQRGGARQGARRQAPRGDGRPRRHWVAHPGLVPVAIRLSTRTCRARTSSARQSART